MATNFPSSADNFTNPTSGSSLSSPSHSQQHADANDAIEALQAKVGVDGSAVTTSHDYKITQLEGKSPTITLAGDASGSVTLTNLGSGTLTVTVNDDSHSHTIANVDDLQTTLDGKAASSHTHSYLPLSGGTVSGDLAVSGRFQIGGHYIDDVAGSGNPYGSINVGGAMSWDGYAIDERVVFMHDGGSGWGIYNDVNQHWMIYGELAGTVNLYHNNSIKLYTDSSGVMVNGRVHATDVMYVGSNGSGDSNIFFYDDNSNTWRTLQWDDSANDWAVEDNGGTMRKLYHSGNAIFGTRTTVSVNQAAQYGFHWTAATVSRPANLLTSNWSVGAVAGKSTANVPTMVQISTINSTSATFFIWSAVTWSSGYLYLSWSIR